MRQDDTTLRRKEIAKVAFATLLAASIAVVSCLRIPGQALTQKILWSALAVVGVAQLGSYAFGWDTPNWLRPRSQQSLLLLLWMFVPFGIVALYSVVYCSIVGDQIGTAVQAITTSVYILVDIFMVFLLLNVFGRNTIRLLAVAVIVSYGLTFVIATMTVGAENILTELKKDGERNLFESHDVGVAVVPLIMALFYFFIRERKEKKPVRGDVLLASGLFLVLLLCGKRSGYLSLCVGTLVAVMLLASRKSKFPWAETICLAGFLACFLYVVLIHTGALDFISRGFGTLSDRYYVWKWFDQQYTLMPTYLGKGFGYVHRYMVNGIGPGLVTVYNYLHNSILQIYIEAGFVGFLAWFGVYFGVMPRVALRIGGKRLQEFVIASMAAMAAMFTIDNTLTYPVYQVCLMASIGVVLMYERAKNNQLAETAKGIAK